MKKAVSYVRVSSKEQRDEGYSIQAQQKLLEEYASRKGLELVECFEEAESAKRAGRTEFGKMVRFLRRNRSVTHVLVEKTDRLYRNFRDLVTIDDLGVTLHFVKEGQILAPDSRSSDKLNHNIKVVLAKNYIDNLGEESSKGMLQKAEQGLYPSFAPLGYCNNRETGGIDVDWERAHIIREVFDGYASGHNSIRDVTRLAAERGLKSRKGAKVCASQFANILRNPIYIGDYLWKGKYYKGKHEPIITRDVFERVQRQFRVVGKPRPKKHRFAFRGLVRCGTCGCTITAERKKGRYVYYRCTHARGGCAEKPVTEAALAKMLGEPLKRLRITDERLEWIKKALRESHEDEKAVQKQDIARLQAEWDELQRKIDAAYEDKLAGTITETFWRRINGEYCRRQDAIRARQEGYTDASRDYLEDGVRILELAKDAYRLYVTQEPDEQRKLLDLLLSNSTLQGGKVQAELAEVFQILADGAVEEKRMRRQNEPESAIIRNWLPG